MRIIAIANQKGGVGKTTTAVNLATALAAVGKKVVLVDLDPQGNASTGFGISYHNRTHSSYHVLMGECSAKEALVATEIPNLSVIPATDDLSGADIELFQREKREFCLKNAFQSLQGFIDYVFIDCPPTLGLLTLNALVAAQSILIPLQCEFYALEGLAQLMRTVQRVQHVFNPDLEIQGIVLTMFDKRNSLSDLVAEDVREHFQQKVYETIIPRNVRVSEAPSHGKPVLLYDFKCSGAQSYVKLAKELLQKEGVTVE